MAKFFKTNDERSAYKATPIGIPRVVYILGVIFTADSGLFGFFLVVSIPNLYVRLIFIEEVGLGELTIGFSDPCIVHYKHLSKSSEPLEHLCHCSLQAVQQHTTLSFSFRGGGQ